MLIVCVYFYVYVCMYMYMYMFVRECVRITLVQCARTLATSYMPTIPRIGQKRTDLYFWRAAALLVRLLLLNPRHTARDIPLLQHCPSNRLQT